MIDFRYHLVSLVSVFLALAVGVVLGAGPLQGAIEDRVVTLTQEKDNLRGELQTAQSGLRERDAFAEAVAPAVLARALSERTVTLVSLPDSDTRTGTALAQAIADAGGRVLNRVSIQPEWLSPDTLEQRRALAVTLAGDLLDIGSAPRGRPSTSASVTSASGGASAGAMSASGRASITGTAQAAGSPVATPNVTKTTTRATPKATQPSTAPTPPSQSGSPPVAATADPSIEAQVQPVSELDTILARSLAGSDGSDAVDAAAARILGELSDAGLVKIEGERGRRSELVVVVAAAVPQVKSGESTAAADLVKARSTPWAELALALDDAGSGVVAVGPASSANDAGLLATIRSRGSIADEVSSVDTGESVMATLTTVLALAEQWQGGAGAYGFAKGASQPIPEIAEAG